jgi:hypothetical protein
MLLFLVTTMAACTKSKKLNEKLTFWKNDKIPYGTFYAFENLKHLFPDADIVVNKTSPDRYRISEIERLNRPDDFEDSDDGQSAYIIIAPVVAPDNRELQALFNYVSEGNHVFIAAMKFSENLLDSLHLKTTHESGFEMIDDSLTVKILRAGTSDTVSYAYPGRQLDNSLKTIDKSITEVLGFNKLNKPNFVKFSYEDGGSLYLQLAPAAFTNFFLLHKENKSYYDNAFSYLPKDVSKISWDEYFRYHRNGRGNQDANDFSAFSWMMKQPALAWTLWLLLLLFLMVYLFESKRKQRIIPVKPKLKNASVDFVKTIGRLYFQRRDNKNLASKMITQFLEQVRQHYNMPTSNLDEAFEQKLAYKSGHSATEVKDLVYHLKMVQDRPLITDELLMEFNNKLEMFTNKFKDGR